jgi:hypothetical protein
MKFHTIADPALLRILRAMLAELARIAAALEAPPEPPARIPTSFHLSVRTSRER